MQTQTVHYNVIIITDTINASYPMEDPACGLINT